MGPTAASTYFGPKTSNITSNISTNTVWLGACNPFDFLAEFSGSTLLGRASFQQFPCESHGIHTVTSPSGVRRKSDFETESAILFQPR